MGPGAWSRVVWQTRAPHEHSPRVTAAMLSWRELNRGFKHIVVGDAEMDRFVRLRLNASHPGLVAAYARLPLPVMRADVWRYAILYVYGGVYADADSVCVRPIRTWGTHGCRALVGLENDEHMCQWTLWATRRHPLFDGVLREIQRRLAADGGVDVGRRGASFVHYYTGPEVWTSAVLDYIDPYGRVAPRPRCERCNANLTILQDNVHRGVCVRNVDFFRGYASTNLYASQFLKRRDSWVEQRKALCVRAGVRCHGISTSYRGDEKGDV